MLLNCWILYTMSPAEPHIAELQIRPQIYRIRLCNSDKKWVSSGPNKSPGSWPRGAMGEERRVVVVVGGVHRVAWLCMIDHGIDMSDIHRIYIPNSPDCRRLALIVARSPPVAHRFKTLNFLVPHWQNCVTWFVRSALSIGSWDCYFTLVYY